MIEHWVERYHQVGYKYDGQWRLLKNERLKAEIRSRREHIATHPLVCQRVNLLKNVFNTGPKKRTTEKMASQREIKKNRRQESLQEAAALHVVPSILTEDDAEIAEILAGFSAKERADDAASAKMLMQIRGEHFA